jgi:hypothetical protein
MAISSADISFVLSGGSENSDPLLSLGGDPSGTRVTGSLFDDITDARAEDGYIDYRCVYITNDSDSDTLYEAAVYIDEETAGGLDVELGFLFQDDTQTLSIVSGTSVTSGSFTLGYDEDEFVVNHNSTVSTWASNFQTAIRAITGLEDVEVTGDTSGSTVIFTIGFTDTAGGRYHPLLEMITNSLVGGGSVTIAKTIEGSPINSVAPETDRVTTAPTDIEFSAYTSSAKASLGELRAADVVPVWIRRTCEAGQVVVENDGFSLKMSGSPFE